MVRTSCILQALAEKFDITVSKEDIIQNSMNMSNLFQRKDKKELIEKDLENESTYKQQEQFALNEKVIAFLTNYFVK